MIKSLKKNDIRTTPFTATKTWNPQNKKHKDLILWQSGSISGSLLLTFRDFNDGTNSSLTYASSAIAFQQQDDDYLRYREGFAFSGSISPTGSIYYDSVLSEKNVDGTYKQIVYATTKHLFYKESEDPTKIFGLESLDSSKVNRSLPQKISTFNVPQNKFGEKIVPNTVEINHEIQGTNYKVVDDGNSNLILEDSTFINYQNIVSNKILAKIQLVNFINNKFVAVYNGSSVVVTATTVPTNLSYIVTYNGSTSAPSEIGTYEVIATINDEFYEGSVTGTLIIEKGTLSISLSNLVHNYDGNPKSVTISPSTVKYDVTYTRYINNVLYTYVGSVTDAGIYTVTVNVVDRYYKGTASATFVINKINSTVTTICPSQKIYGDPNFTIPVTTNNSTGNISFSIVSGPGKISTDGRIQITGAGTLQVKTTVSSTQNYNLNDSNVCSITVNPKQLTILGLTVQDKLYSSGNTTATILGTPILSGQVSYDDVKITGTPSGNFVNDAVGINKNVTLTGLSLSGTDSSKYTLLLPILKGNIKQNTVVGTITLDSKTFTYDGTEKTLNASINNQSIPIIVTYKKGNNVIATDSIFNSLKLHSGTYPKDVGTYDVIAELDTSKFTTEIYSVSTIQSKLIIVSILGDVKYGPNIFYFDGNKKPVQIISTTPPNSKLDVKYADKSTPTNFTSTAPTNVGNYIVNVKFIDSNVSYEKNVDLIIKTPVNNNCNTTIKNETINQQYQKNIIDLTSNVGTVQFNYTINKGASQFKIEYPLNSGNIVYDTKLSSKEYSIGTKVVDYITGNSLEISKFGNPVDNVSVTFDKNQKGKNPDTNVDSDKCLISTYSPTENNDWNISIGCVLTPAPKIDDLYQNGFELSDEFTPQDAKQGPGYRFHITGFYIQLFIPPGGNALKAQLDGGNITQFEYDRIRYIIQKNNSLVLAQGSITLTDDVSNIKIIITTRGQPYYGEPTEIDIIYRRVTDSLLPSTVQEPAPLAFDCHLYEYKGTKISFDIQDAIVTLKSQINSDTFKNTFLSLGNTITVGETQRNYLLNYVSNLPKLLQTVSEFDNIIFKLNSAQTNPNTSKDTDIAGILNQGIIYLDQNTQRVQICYPAICMPRNFGQG